MTWRKTLAAALVAAAPLPGCMKMADRGAPAASGDKAAAPAESLRSLGYVGGAATVQVATAGTAAAGAPAAASSTRPGGLAAGFAALKLIRTAQVTVEVAKYDQAAREVARVAQSVGGYVAESQATRGERDRQSGTVTIKVPAGRFGEALAALKGLGKVRSENVSTQDVTKAYTDLETRLRVKRDTAERLRALLRARTAALADVLGAERELARVTEEIEQMEGERRFYDQQVAFSTIALTLLEPQALVEPGLFAPVGDALRDSVRVLSRSLALLVYLVVFLAPWALVAFAAWRIVRAVRARKRPAPAAHA